MKKQGIKKYLSVILSMLCVLSLTLTGCTNKFSVNDAGQYVDKKTNIAYIDAPACYEPIYIDGEIYAKIGSAEVYKIVGADSSKLLCESTGTVFYASDVALPALNEMNISYVSITMDDVELVKVTDASLISELVNAYCMGESIKKPTYVDDTLDISWRLRFADESIGIYYSLNYIEISEDYITTSEDGSQTNYGTSFIFNRFEGKCVVAGDLLKTYVDEYNNINQADE